jgi:uncharacterized membrane protein YhaH (DUF805 family)
MSFGQAISAVFSKYATFTGVARRSEFWWWYLFVVVVGAVLRILDGVIFGLDSMGQANTSLLAGLWGLATIVPTLAVAVRRLRDADRPWYNLFWYLLPLVGWIILIVKFAKPSAGIVAKTV